MAIYHLEATPIKRSTGRSSVAAAAYRAGECLEDVRTGQTHDYTRKQGVVFASLVMPPGANGWQPTRTEFWNAAEKANGRADAVNAREFRLALPHELTPAQRQALALDFAHHLVERFGVACDLAIHLPDRRGDERNHHVHLLLSAKRVRGQGFGTKAIELDPISSKRNAATRNGPNAVKELRPVWDALTNAALEAAGHEARIDHRSYEARGIDREPTEHLGPTATAMERRGKPTERGDLNRAITAGNERQDQRRDERDSLTLAIRDAAGERAEHQAARAERAAARTLDPERILAAVTERRSTFTRHHLDRLLRAEIPGLAQRTEAITALLARHEVIGLREAADGPVTRYTTRTVLAAEMAILSDARRLGELVGHGLSDQVRWNTLDRFSYLDPEQRAALMRATGAGGLCLIAGEAGTGKSTTMGAIRTAYKAAGFQVIGLAWTNTVVQDLKADGFTNAATLASALLRLERHPEAWNRRTVLMVDEAAMLSTRHLAVLMHKAAEVGAKVILTGDDHQLASIERGGVFGALRLEHGAAELHQVRRVTDAEQRRAFNLMHQGEFRPALAIFHRQGAIHWSDNEAAARAALVARYAADVAASPGKSRFVFASSNAEVAMLNRDLRALRRVRGELGPDQVLPSADGPAAFAVGDRIILTTTAAGREARASGFINGAAGTILAIDGVRVTASLDGRGKHAARVVSFTAGANAEAGEFNGFRHGYAGTIYKGQGRTLDQTYVLHAPAMSAASSYVALSRHRERVGLFAVRGPESWMAAKGGLEALTPAQRAGAERAYARWAEGRPALAMRHGLAGYVAYVQAEQAKRPPDDSHALDRLARQMGRIDDRRSAMQFHATPGQHAAGQAPAWPPRDRTAPPPFLPELAQACPTPPTFPEARAEPADPAAAAMARMRAEAAQFRLQELPFATAGKARAGGHSFRLPSSDRAPDTAAEALARLHAEAAPLIRAIVTEGHLPDLLGELVATGVTCWERLGDLLHSVRDEIRNRAEQWLSPGVQPSRVNKPDHELDL